MVSKQKNYPPCFSFIDVVIFSGYFAIGNVSYHIEPKGDDFNSRHRVIRSSDDVKTNFRCGS